MIERNFHVEIVLSPQEMATAFCEMDADHQAAFFSEVAVLTSGWERAFCFQAQYITDSDMLTDAGRSIMRVIGEYGEPA